MTFFILNMIGPNKKNGEPMMLEYDVFANNRKKEWRCHNQKSYGLFLNHMAFFFCSRIKIRLLAL